MTIEELAEECKTQIELGGEDAYVLLYFPKRKWGKTNTRRLCKGGPTGIVINELDGGITVQFKAQEILDFIEQIGEESEDE